MKPQFLPLTLAAPPALAEDLVRAEVRALSICTTAGPAEARSVAGGMARCSSAPDGTRETGTVIPDPAAGAAAGIGPTPVLLLPARVAP